MVHTTEGNPRSGHNTCLNDSIFLPSKGLFQKPWFIQELSPCLNKEKPQQTSWHIKRRNDSTSEIQLHHNKSEQNPQHKAHNKSPHSQLALPWRHFSILKNHLNRLNFFDFIFNLIFRIPHQLPPVQCLLLALMTRHSFLVVAILYRVLVSCGPHSWSRNGGESADTTWRSFFYTTSKVDERIFYSCLYVFGLKLYSN